MIMAGTSTDRLPEWKVEAHDKAPFEPVLRNLRRDQLASFASNIRCYGHRSVSYEVQYCTLVACDVLETVSCGSYNAVFNLKFTDGVDWVLKVPSKGHGRRWTSATSKALESEAQTLRLIRRETTIPVPKVYAFDSSLNNEIGCPFIVMERIQGRALNYGWFNQDVSIAKRKTKFHCYPVRLLARSSLKDSNPR